MYNYGDLQMTYVKVEITDQDVERVETLARKRDAKKVKFGAGRHGYLPDSSEQSHSYGLFGELAVAKYFNIELDDEIYDDHGDAGYDFIIAGLKADVKTATNGAAYYEPWLKVPTQTDKDKAKLEKADIFIACFYHLKGTWSIFRAGLTKNWSRVKSQNGFATAGPANGVRGITWSGKKNLKIFEICS